MTMRLSGKKQWQCSQDVMQTIGEYEVCHLGICDVAPNKIIGLCLWPPEELMADDKMRRLYESVKRNGWHDKFPQDLDLCLLPSGEFVVGSGGVHRTILSNELGIPFIKANVDLLMPSALISTEVHKAMAALRAQDDSLRAEAKKVHLFLVSKGIWRDGYPVEERQFDDFVKAQNVCHDKVQQLLKEEAFRLGLIPRALKVLRVRINR